MILLLYSSKRVHHGLLKKISSKARQSPKVRGRDQRKKKKTGEERVPHLSLTLEFFQNLSPALFFHFFTNKDLFNVFYFLLIREEVEFTPFVGGRLVLQDGWKMERKNFSSRHMP